MSDDTVPVTVTIFEKEFRIACPPEEKEGLETSARYVNEMMIQLRDSGRIIGTEKIAVMAALHIAHELLSTRQNRQRQNGYSPQLRQRLRALDDQVRAVLHAAKQFDV